MTHVVTYSMPDGPGAVVHLDDAGNPQWIGLFGHGYNGLDYVLSGARGTDGTFTLSRRIKTESNLFPNTTPHINQVVGECRAAITDFNNRLEISYAVDAYKLGLDPNVQFSPPIEATQTGTLVLFRL